MKEYELGIIQLGQIEISDDNLRKTASPAATRMLTESIEANGLLAPFVVSRISKNKYHVWDGTRRTRILNDLNYPKNTKIPALIVTGNDSDAVIRQININQARERLSQLAEAEALYYMVKKDGWSQTDAARKLLKTKSWASKIMTIWELPKEIISELRKGNLHLSHCIVMAKFRETPKVLNMLFKQALSGKISRSQLMALGKQAANEGVTNARKREPKLYKLTAKSWIRTQPLQKGNRLELHIDNADEKALIKKRLKEIIDLF